MTPLPPRARRIPAGKLVVLACAIFASIFASSALAASPRVSRSSSVTFPKTLNLSPLAQVSSTSKRTGRRSSRTPRVLNVPIVSGPTVESATLSTTSGRWSLRPDRYEYAWYACNAAGRSCTLIGSADSSRYVVNPGVVGARIRSYVVAISSRAKTAAISSPTASIRRAIPINTVLPVVSGTAQAGNRLSASHGSWMYRPSTYSYAWQRCAGGACSPISGATSAQYAVQPADAPDNLEVKVTAHNSYGSSAPAASVPSSNALPLPPLDVTAPIVSGTAQQGQTLTATTGTWSSSPTSFSYTWESCPASVGSVILGECVPIAGATSSAYTVKAADVGEEIIVVVGASNAAGPSLTTATSSPTAAVAPSLSAPVNSTAPSISGGSVSGDTLTATTGTWGNAPTGYAYQWDDCDSSGTGCTAISGTTGTQYTLTSSDVGDRVAVVVSAANATGSSSASSAATPTVTAPLPAAPTNTSAPAISGTAQQGDTLTASNGSWTGSPTSYTYQWQDCNTSGTGCSAISGATTSTHTLTSSDVGDRIEVVVSASNAGGSSSANSAASATITAATPSAPANSAAPAISGTAQQGDTLTASNGSWTGSPTSYTYQWQDCNTSGTGCSAISGATTSTHTLQASDVGDTIVVTVAASNAGGSSSAVASHATATVTAPLPAAPTNTSAPAISGTAQQGDTLTASNGSWTGSPTSYTYQWQDCNTSGTGCSAISGATTSTHTLTSSDVGDRIEVVVSASNAGGSSSANSAASATITAATPSAPANSAAPAISGTAQQGDTLTASNGSWTGSPTSYTYQWQDCNTSGTGCSAISGATTSTHTLQASDVGDTIVVTVAASNAGGSSSAVASHATATVTAPLPAAPTNTSAPAISGTAQQGDTLTASNGSWTGSPTSYTYQWQDCNTSGTGCSAISGATTSTYTLQASDVGGTIVVTVAASNPGGSSSAAASNATAAVAGSSGSTQPASCSGSCKTAPVISGTAKVGSVLTVSKGTWSTTINAYSYKWEDCNGSSCSPVSYGIETPQCSGTSFSCTQALETNFSSYTVQPSDEGDELAVVVTAENGSSYTATAASTQVIGGGAPDNTTAPTASGTATIGSVLTATQGTWSGSSNTYSYQWNDCVEDDILPSGCQAISGATSSTYTIKSSDGGYKLDVTVTASNSNGSQSVSSNQTSSYVPVPPAAIGTPTIAGQAVLGARVAAMYHFSGSVPSYSYQWEDCNSSGGSCSAIGGATSQAYTIGSSDEGSTLRVVVTASNDGGAQSASATSPASPVIQIPTGSGSPVSTGLPVISGTAAYGSTITTSVGTWSGVPTSYSYQWQDCNSSGSSCSNVTAGGNAYSYTIGATDTGQYLRVAVTATNSTGSAATDSTLTAAVPTPSASQTAATPDGLTIVGDKFENDTGQPVVFHGEDLSGTDTACGNDGAFSDNMPATGATGAALAPWNSNGVTLGTNEDCWLGINGTSPSGGAYQSDMNSFVNLLNSYGQYVMLSSKATSPGAQESGPSAGEANAPDEDHSPWYWAGLADQFRNDPNVVDAVWSELASTAVYWNCYMTNECGSTASASGPGPYDGGGVCGAGAWSCYYYTVATMQQAVDITRAMGFNGPISIPCIGYAVVCGDPNTGGSTYGGSWAQNHPADPVDQMTAEAHWYEQDACDTNACHLTQLSTINAAGYPLILGETGESGDNNAAPSCGSWSGSYNPPSTYGTYSSSYNGTEGWLPDLYSNGVSGWFAYAFNDFNSAGVLLGNTSGAPYQPGTQPASGWYSDCLQTLDRGLAG